MKSLASCKIVQLSESLVHQLNLYAVGATAAGVGVLAMAVPANAKIVYTPAKIKIVFGDQIGIDLNHDGINDITFSDNSQSGATNRSSLGVGAPKGGIAELFKNGKGLGAAALKAGVGVGSSQYFNSGLEMAYWCGHVGSGTCQRYGGPWGGKSGQGIKNRYLGVRFKIKGKLHYGWMRMTVDPYAGKRRDIVGHLMGYAYETVPNKAIVTGKTKGPDVITMPAATLGQLARGAGTRRSGQSKYSGIR